MEFASLFCQSDRQRRPPEYFSFETAPPKPAPRVAKAKKGMYSSHERELDARSLTPPPCASASAELGACPKSLPPAEIEVFYNRAQRMLLKEVCALRCPTALQLTWIHLSINLLLELRMQCHACAHSCLLLF
jgi:hypothetical protein